MTDVSEINVQKHDQDQFYNSDHLPYGLTWFVADFSLGFSLTVSLPSETVS